MDPNTFLIILLLSIPIGLLIGIACGVVGYSAWPMVVPLLFVIAGVDLYEAIFASVCVDLVNSIVMTVIYKRRGEVNVKEAVKLGGTSVIGVILGALLAFAILDRFTSLFRGGVGYVNLLLGVLFVLRGRKMRKQEGKVIEEVAAQLPGKAIPGTDGVEPAPEPGKKDPFLVRLQKSLSDKQKEVVTMVFCLINAFLVGLVGFGGGFNVVLFLIILLSIPPIRAVGTAMVYAVIVLSVLAFCYLVFLGFTVTVWPFILAYGALSAIGLLLGTRFAKKISEPGLYILIGVIVAVTGIAATIQTLLIS